VLGRDDLLVRLSLGDGDDDRVIAFEPHGAAWQARTAALCRALASCAAAEADVAAAAGTGPEGPAR
jgi:hypothetical protein